MFNFIVSSIVIFSLLFSNWGMKNSLNFIIKAAFFALVMLAVVVLKKDVGQDTYVLVATGVYGFLGLIWSIKKQDLFYKAALIGMSLWGFWIYFS